MFFKVFGVQECPRQPRKAHEGSREAPETLRNLKKGIPKQTQFLPVFDQFWNDLGTLRVPTAVQNRVQEKTQMETVLEPPSSVRGP